MNNIKLLLVSVLTLVVIHAAGIAPASAQSQSTALERGYRTGYSDGYNAGFKDTGDRAPRNYQAKDDYQRAERNYNEVWGPIEDYRDGYQQGFEAGYSAGYDRHPFNSSIPTGLRRRATYDAPVADNNQGTQASDDPDTEPVRTTASGNVFLPRDTVLLVEMLSSLSTDATQRGDRFQARVIEPGDLEGAIIDGRVIAVKRAGKVKGTAELQLSFDSLRLPDNRTANINADVIEVVDMSGSDGVGKVDPEGGVRGKDSTKDDVTKVGAGTGIGALIGAIAGGGKGAAIGAAIGGGVVAGKVMTDRGKDIRLDRGQQLRIRTATETRIAQVN